MSKRIFYHPHNLLTFAFLMLILAIAVAWLFIGTLGTAFERVGFSPTTTATILIATFLGSAINIPLLKIKTVAPIVRERYVSFFGIGYRIPQTEYGEATTLLAVNVGGALIPTMVSTYLLWKVPSYMAYALIDVVVVALVTHLVARPVKGVGVVSPVLVSPPCSGLNSVSSALKNATDSSLRRGCAGNAYRWRSIKPSCRP